MSEGDGEKQPIIIKKIKKGGHGHHGGAWKVAYADFVTAMMAFFLLLWLLNVTTDEMKAKLSAFFTDPTHPQISSATGGAGGVLGGRTSSPEGARAHDNVPLAAFAPPSSRGQTGQGKGKSKDKLKKVKDAELKKEFERREKEKFKTKKQELEQAIEANPRLSKLSENIVIEVTSEGLKIQIVDQEGEAMFPSGSARMFSKTEDVLSLISDVIKDMPNDLSIRGHTDSIPFTSRDGYSNWELSADRANATRRVLTESGYPDDKVSNVVGKAANDPYVEDDPADAKNRRISIVLLNQEFTDDEAAALEAEGFDDSIRDGAYTDDGSLFDPEAEVDPGYEPSQGEIYFP